MTVTKLAMLKYDLDQARGQYRIVNKRLGEAFDAYKQAVLKKAGQRITLKKALEVYIGDDRVENAPGYKWLTDRTWTGDWMGAGVGFTGEYTPATNQRMMRLWVYDDITPPELATLAGQIREIMGALKPHPDEWDGKPDAFAGHRIMSISRSYEDDDDDRGQYHLGLDLANKRWVLWNTKYKRSKIVADRNYARLGDMLKEIKKIAPLNASERSIR